MNRLGFKSNIFLAPMAGITDKPMRRLVSSFGPGTVVSEMVAVNAVQRRNPKSYRIADVRDEPYPVVVQLVGGEASLFADVVKLIEELGAFSVDINMGCPVGKVIRKLRHGSIKRMRAKLRHWEKEYPAGLVTREQILQSWQAWDAHAAHGNTWTLRQQVRDRVQNILKEEI